MSRIKDSTYRVRLTNGEVGTTLSFSPPKRGDRVCITNETDHSYSAQWGTVDEVLA